MKEQLVKALLVRHGQTYAEELGIDLRRGSPSALFRLLCAALLFGARIRASTAVAAARALAARGWTTPQKLAAASWEDRAGTLKRAGYARSDERTSMLLGRTADLVLERWGGDLRRLRREAECDPGRERALLKLCPGIGDVAVDIFLREVQVSWREIAPFADRRALDAAMRLGLGRTTSDLVGLVDDRDFARLVAALVRTSLDDDYDAVVDLARSGLPT